MLLVTLSGDTRGVEEDYYHTVRQAQYGGVGTSQNCASSPSWQYCLDFCTWITLAPNMPGVCDPIPYLHIFSEWFIFVSLSENSEQVQKLAVEG